MIPCRLLAHGEKKARPPFPGNPAISLMIKRPVAFRPRLATGLACNWIILILMKKITIVKKKPKINLLNSIRIKLFI